MQCNGNNYVKEIPSSFPGNNGESEPKLGLRFMLLALFCFILTCEAKSESLQNVVET